MAGKSFGRVCVLLAVALAFSAVACAASQSSPDYAAVLMNPERPNNERALDEARKPAQVMAFYGVKRGDKVADLISGSGYYTAILSQIVGPEGLVYSANMSARKSWLNRFKQPEFANVKTIIGPMDEVALPQDGSLDFVLTHLNYHDLSREVRTGMNKRVFAALKHGGIYGVVDHAAREGSGDSDAKTLHRIDKRLVIQEVTSAGFRLDKEGTMLRRPEDTRDFSVLMVRNKDERFVLAFVKP
jgi:predicted methyltransferase